MPLPVGFTILVLAALLMLAALLWARVVDRRRRPRPGPTQAPPRLRETLREPDRVR
jgi:membrane protein implicated in regulation of membrane protease activity